MCNKKTTPTNVCVEKKAQQSSATHTPSLEEIKIYIEEKGYSVDAKKLKDYYDEVGWKKTSGLPIKDWRATVRAWERDKRGTVDNGAQSGTARTGQGYSSRGIEETKKMLDRIAKEEQKAISHKEWLAQQNNGTK